MKSLVLLVACIKKNDHGLKIQCSGCQMESASQICTGSFLLKKEFVLEMAEVFNSLLGSGNGKGGGGVLIRWQDTLRAML